MDLQVEQLLIKKPWSLQGEKEKEKEIKVGTFGIYKKPKFRVFLFQDFIWYISSLSLSSSAWLPRNGGKSENHFHHSTKLGRLY